MVDRFLLSVLLLATPFWAPTHASPAPAPRLPIGGEDCAGCSGSGGTSSSSNGVLGGVVSIQILMTSGRCKLLRGDGPLQLFCDSLKNCQPTIVRTWANLPLGTPLEFCLYIGATPYCFDILSLTGFGSDSREALPMACLSGVPMSFSVVAGGLSATATAHCTSCEGEGSGSGS